MFSYISLMEWSRLGLLYSHLILCALAISAVLRADIAIFSGSFTRRGLEQTAKSTSHVLLALWATGLAIIYIDTGFDLDVLQGKGKLLLKLMCVLTLTANGIVLHYVSFPILTKDTGLITRFEATLLVTTGALSTTHWLAAAFVGMSKPLGRIPLDVLGSTYLLLLGSALLASVCFIPFIRSRLSGWHNISADARRRALYAH